MSRVLTLSRIALVPLLVALAVVTTSSAVIAAGNIQVSNIGRATNFTNSSSSGGGISHVFYAGKFTTGTVPSVLTGAQAVLKNSSFYGPATYEARIYSDAGSVPGSLLMTFDNNPINAGDGVTTITQSFDKPAGFELAASTSYWLAIRNTSGGYFGWPTTYDDGEDSLGGWTIDNSAVASSSNAGSSWGDISGINSGRVPQFAILTTSVAPCQPGSYSANGNEPCTPAPAGSYVSGSGATAATLCPPGTYSDAAGSVACTPAPVGSYVSGSGATEATFCPPGTYSDAVGSVACTPAPIGAYVDSSGATASTLCPEGTTTTAVGSDSVDDCILVDSDGDGIHDVDDLCPLSDLSSTVVIDGQDTGVPNLVLSNGCSISDLIAAAAAEASTHGEFASAVAALTNELKADGYITGKQNGAIQSAAAQADLP